MQQRDKGASLYMSNGGCAHSEMKNDPEVPYMQSEEDGSVSHGEDTYPTEVPAAAGQPFFRRCGSGVNPPSKGSSPKQLLHSGASDTGLVPALKMATPKANDGSP